MVKIWFSIQPETQILTLGAALASKAQVLDNFIASNLLTQVHGDCKGWNLFFMKKSDLKEISAVEKSPVLFIDMQWTGVGHPLQVIDRFTRSCIIPSGIYGLHHAVITYLHTRVTSVELSRVQCWISKAKGLWKRPWKMFPGFGSIRLWRSDLFLELIILIFMQENWKTSVN